MHSVFLGIKLMYKKIITPCYDHILAKEQLKNQLSDSLRYMSEFLNRNHIDDFKMSWRICAAHYMAIVAAENENPEASNFYLDYIHTIKSAKNFTIEPIVENDSIENKMILRIIEDDSQVGFGFCIDLDLSIREEQKIKQALTILEKFEPNSFKEIMTYIDTIYLTMGSPNGQRFMRSGTNFYMWGLVFLYINDEHSVAYYLEHLIHECAHTALNLINSYDKLIVNDAEERFDAPFRKDPRPMIGIFHAYFVLSRICYVFNILSVKVEGSICEEIKVRLAHAVVKLKETHDIVDKYAKFTPIGRIIHEEIKGLWGF